MSAKWTSEPLITQSGFRPKAAVYLPAALLRCVTLKETFVAAVARLCWMVTIRQKSSFMTRELSWEPSSPIEVTP